MQAIPKRRKFRSQPIVGRWVAEIHSLGWRSSVALGALDQLCAGVIIADNGGKVIEMNRAAESIVRLEDGLNIRNGRLCARRTFETVKVAKLISGATADGKLGVAAGRMLVGRCDGLPAYVLTVAPLRSDMAVDHRRFAMIVVVDPERHSPSEKDLAEFFGLSPAEARLAAALLTGKTLSQIAASTGIRITTVRTQLGSILRKVGAERQSDLIRILSSTGIGSVSFSAGWFNIAQAATEIPLWFSGRNAGVTSRRVLDPRFRGGDELRYRSEIATAAESFVPDPPKAGPPVNTACSGLTARTWPTTSGSNSMRIAAKCNLTVGLAAVACSGLYRLIA
jgi:DNA-binding CsgD family transcriptional regulator